MSGVKQTAVEKSRRQGRRNGDTHRTVLSALLAACRGDHVVALTTTHRGATDLYDRLALVVQVENIDATFSRERLMIVYPQPEGGIVEVVPSEQYRPDGRKVDMLFTDPA